MTCKQWGVVVVPFPFSPHPGTKRRPALVLGGRTFNARGQTVLGMIPLLAIIAGQVTSHWRNIRRQD